MRALIGLMMVWVSTAYAEIWVPEDGVYVPHESTRTLEPHQSEVLIDVGHITHNRVGGDASSYGIAYLSTDTLFFGLFDSMIGYMNVTGSSHYYYAGLGKHWRIHELWRVGIDFAPGYYVDHGNLPLGHHLIFRTHLWVGMKVSPHQMVGIGWSHLSNGGLGDLNPGTDIAGLVYRVSF